jgi:hypothetical protein
MKDHRFEISSEQTLRLAELRDALAKNLPEGVAERVEFPVASNATCNDCHTACQGACVSCTGTCTNGCITCKQTCFSSCTQGCGTCSGVNYGNT